MKDLLGHEVSEKEFAMTPAEKRRKYSQPRGYAAPPGTGPKGETCRTCAFACGHRHNAKTYYKCDLIKPTNGAGTDIRLKSPACSRWKKEEPVNE